MQPWWADETSFKNVLKSYQLLNVNVILDYIFFFPRVN